MKPIKKEIALDPIFTFRNSSNMIRLTSWFIPLTTLMNQHRYPSFTTPVISATVVSKTLLSLFPLGDYRHNFSLLAISGFFSLFFFPVSLFCFILTSLSCSCPFTKQPYHSTAKFLKTQLLSQIFPVQKFFLFTKNKMKNPLLKFLSVYFLSLNFLVE